MALSLAIHGFLLPLAAGDGGLLPENGTTRQEGPLLAVLRDAGPETPAPQAVNDLSPPLTELPAQELPSPPDESQPTVSTVSHETSRQPRSGGRSGKPWAAWPRIEPDGQAYPKDSIAFLEGDPTKGARVKLEIFVSSEGVVVEAVVVETSLTADETEAIRRRVMATPFQPAIDGGKPVDIRTDFEIARTPIPKALRQGN